MKSLLKILVVAAAFGLSPSVALAQPSPTVTTDPVAANAAAPTAEAAATSAPAIARAAPEHDVGQPSGRIGFQEQYTGIGEQGAWFHDIILMPIITIISIFVLALLLWVIVRYRRAASPEPSRTSHNTLIEIVWTVVPVLVLVAIALPSIDLLRAQYSPPKPDLTVKVIGNQWYWTYQYPDNGDFELVSNMLPAEEASKRGEPRLLGVDERMVVPAGATVKLIVTATDVIHSWGIPSFWVKMDAVPGRLNETWFKVDRPGVYYGQCYELCGARHGFMPIAVEVVPPAQFAAWVASKGGSMPVLSAAAGGVEGPGTAGTAGAEGATAPVEAAPEITANSSATAPAAQESKAQ